MLEQIFGSRTRVKLLRLFLTNPGKKFFVRELTRLTEEQINSVRREIDNLKSIGLIHPVAADQLGKKERQERGWQKKYYIVDKNFPLYDEIRSLMVKAKMILEKDIVKNILAIGQIRYLAFCGLFCNDPESPTDIFVVGRISRSKLSRLLKKMSRGFEREINYTVMTKQEYLYRKDITDKFLYRILEGKKILIINKLNQDE